MYHFIVNPAAGGGRTMQHIPALQKHMELRELPYRISYTEKPMDAKRLAQNACQEKSDGVICVGGDGTIQEAAGGMLYTGVPLGIIPAGSGNDFIFSLGVKLNAPVQKRLDAILRGHTKQIDAIRMGKFYFTNIGSIGMDAEIVFHAAAFKKSFKRSAYLLSTLKNVLTFQNMPMKLVIDGQELTDDMTLVAVCNGRCYGGGFQIAPQAEIDDGKITLCVIRNLSKPKKTAFFPTVLLGAHEKIKGVEFYPCKKVSIHYDGLRNINLDGNIYELYGPITFEIVPWAIKVFV